MSQIGNPAASSSGPTGPAGGDLSGTYPNPTLAWITRTAAQTLAIGIGGTLAALAFTVPGSGVATALGNTAGGAGGFALVGTTPPTGIAGGDLAGTYPNPILNTAISTAVAFSGLGATTIATGVLTVPNGSTGAPSIRFAASSQLGFRERTTSIIDFESGGGPRISFQQTGSRGIVNLTNTGYFVWSSGTDPDAGPQTTISNQGANVVQLGPDASATPAAQTLQAQGSRPGTDNNVGGANLTIKSGQGTGTGTGSDLIFQTPALAVSGSGAQTMTAALTLKGTTQRTVAATTIGTAGYTVATLPAGVVGDRAYVTDALAPSFLTIVVGGGTVNTPVYFNGANWIGA